MTSPSFDIEGALEETLLIAGSGTMQQTAADARQRIRTEFAALHERVAGLEQENARLRTQTLDYLANQAIPCTGSPRVSGSGK